METQANIQDALAQCTGTENYHYNSIARKAGIVYTEGIRVLTMMCQAWWLIDAIASYQSKCSQDEMLHDMQFWTLRVKNSRAVLICERDSGDVFLTQEIPYTDFPLPEIKIWLERGTVNIDGQPRSMMIAMLPSER